MPPPTVAVAAQTSISGAEDALSKLYGKGTLASRSGNLQGKLLLDAIINAYMVPQPKFHVGTVSDYLL